MVAPVMYWAWVRRGRVHLIIAENHGDLHTGCRHPVVAKQLQRVHDRDSVAVDLCPSCVAAARRIGLVIPGKVNGHGVEGFQY